MSIKILLLVIIILCIYSKRIDYYIKTEQYSCTKSKFQNHNRITASNFNNFRANNIPRKEFIDNRHPYLYLVKDLDYIFPKNNPQILQKWNSRQININKNAIDITTDYIIKMLQIKYKNIFYLIENKNHITYEITDQFNPHYGKTYTIYDLVLQQDDKSNYIVLNVHIVNNDVVKVEFMSVQTTDSYDLKDPYNDDTTHRANFSNDVLYN